MISRVLLSAIVAGFVAGIFVFLIQMEKVYPLILEAELYENTEVEAGDSGADDGVTDEKEFAEMVADLNAWAPEDGLERFMYSLGSNIVTGVGFALILVAGFAISGRSINGFEGFMWGLAGFTAFTLAPGFGLPAELPGMAAAELEGRQAWWLMTAGATVVSLALFAFRKEVLWKVVAVLLIATPHVIGAPHPEEFWGEVPPELAALFVMASLVSNLIFWIALGCTSGWVWSRMEEKA